MPSISLFFRYGFIVSFLLLFGYICFSLGASKGSSSCAANVAIVSGRTDEENHEAVDQAPTLNYWEQIFNTNAPKAQTAQKGKAPKLPEIVDKRPTNELCPSTEEFVRQNVQKLDWIQSQCDNTVRSKLSEIKEMFYFPKSSLGWCPVYKAASSNVFAHFCSDYFDAATCQNKHIKMKDHDAGFRALEDFREKDPPPADEKRFLVVRNPFSRLLSNYRNKVELLSHPNTYRDIFVDTMTHYRPIRWVVNFDKRTSAFRAVTYGESMTEGRNQKKPEADNPYLYPPYPTFKEIVSTVIAGWKNNHIIPASQRCGPCGSTQYDFLLKAENFDCDIKNMFNLTGNLRLISNSERWATNQTPPLNLTMFYSYFSTLTTDQLDDLLHLYQDDCLLFQYPCQENVDKIRKFKSLNPDYEHVYQNTWKGRVGDWDTIS